jgi:Xaa-Pro aminopeptidase
MQNENFESVGPDFDLRLLHAARDKGLELISNASHEIQPGMSEKDAKKILVSAQKELGSNRWWHPPQIRFGPNTLCSFGKKGADNQVLQTNDIYFLDIGPLFDNHEGDVGRTFVVGNDSEMLRCAKDVEAIWHEVRTRWQTVKESGNELYRFAEKIAQARGWTLSLPQANGHRVADFPHTVRRRGTIESFSEHPQADRWILEIQIRHPERPFGAFFEDLLN